MSDIQGQAQQFIDALHELEQCDAAASENQVDKLVTLFSPQTRLTNAALQLAGKEESGIDGARRFWSEYKNALGQCFSSFNHVTVDADAAGLFWTTEGTGMDGQPVKYDGVSLLEYDEEGLIRFFRGYYDTRDLTVKAST